jgi:hypothetical protein
MFRLFSNSVVLVYGEVCGSAPRPQRMVYSTLMDTIEVLRKRVENAATTICNNRSMLKRVEESFRTLNTSCND